jgi:hypothetical protein
MLHQNNQADGSQGSHQANSSGPEDNTTHEVITREKESKPHFRQPPSEV